MKMQFYVLCFRLVEVDGANAQTTVSEIVGGSDKLIKKKTGHVDFSLPTKVLDFSNKNPSSTFVEASIRVG